MNGQSTPSHESPRWCIPESTCRFCIAFDRNLCDATADEPRGPQQSGHVAPARHIIWRGQDLHNVVPFICSGWGTTFVSLSNGRRQITSFLLPGDIISAALLVDLQPYYRIEAITEVYFRVFNRMEFRAQLYKQPDLLENFSKTWAGEKVRADELIADLGRRTAEERIARLIFNLVDRLATRGMVRGEPVEIDFPLRQHHIADATGLTQVHVSTVLRRFRREGLINISNRSLTLLDPGGLRRIADMS